MQLQNGCHGCASRWTPVLGRRELTPRSSLGAWPRGSRLARVIQTYLYTNTVCSLVHGMSRHSWLPTIWCLTLWSVLPNPWTKAVCYTVFRLIRLVNTVTYQSEERLSWSGLGCILIRFRII